MEGQGMRRTLTIFVMMALAALPLMAGAQARSSEGYLIPEGAQPNQPYHPSPQAAPGQPSFETTPDQKMVREAQMALRNAGFDPGGIDGMMGPKTRAALRDFQASHGLPQTGRLDATTQQQLLAQRTPEPSRAREVPSNTPSDPVRRDPLSGDPLYRNPPPPRSTAPGAGG